MERLDIYLLSLKLSGIKNITETISIDFYKKTVDKNFDSSEYRVKAIYGENGAGKTAIVSAVEILKRIIVDGTYLSDMNNQRILDELINKKTQEFFVEVTYLCKSNAKAEVYRYSFVLGKNSSNLYELKNESLEVKNGNYNNQDYKQVFLVHNGKLTTCKVSKSEFKDIESLTVNLLSTHSFISILFKEMVRDMDKFSSLYVHILYGIIFALQINVYMQADDRHELYMNAKNMLTGNSNFDGDIIYWLQQSGINRKRISKDELLVYKEKVNGLCNFIKLFKKDLVSIEVEARENRDYLECELVMDYGEYKISEEFESNGIKKLIKLYDSFVAATRGGIVFIDEMDSNINDVYLCKLIEYFMYYSEGQLCFTTHNIDPMNILKNNKLSIEFLSNDNKLIPWKNFGNSSPENFYRNGMIENLPFNVDPTDFIGVFGT